MKKQFNKPAICAVSMETAQIMATSDKGNLAPNGLSDGTGAKLGTGMQFNQNKFQTGAAAKRSKNRLEN